MIWGDTRAARRDRRARSAPTRRSTSCCCSTTTPQDLRPRHEAEWARGPRPGSPTAPSDADGRDAVASTLPDLIDEDARAASSPTAGSRRSPACAPRWPASGRCGARRATRPGCARSPRRPRGGARRREPEPRRLARRGGGEATARARRGPGPGGRRARRRRRGRLRRRRERARLAGRAEALRPGPAAQERRRRARARHRGDEDAARAARRGCSPRPTADGASLLVERMAPPGVELLIVGARRRGRAGAGTSGSAASGPRPSTTSRSSRCPRTPTRVEEAIRVAAGRAAAQRRAGRRGRRRRRCGGAGRRARRAAARARARAARAQPRGRSPAAGAWPSTPSPDDCEIDYKINDLIGSPPSRRRPAPPLPAHRPSRGHRPSSYDAIVVGGGHNGLTTAAYLARAGLDVVVLERRADPRRRLRDRGGLAGRPGLARLLRRLDAAAEDRLRPASCTTSATGRSRSTPPTRR